MNIAPSWRWLAVLSVVLAGLAWLSPAPDRVTDRDVYLATATTGVVPDCTDLHCFRVLVPWVLGRLPGSPDLVWSLYAAVANAVAAIGVFHLALALGVTPVASRMAAALAAVGFGSLYTLHDPFTADPLMFALGPFITLLVVRERVLSASVLGVVGVLAKEFAAAPLYIGALWALVSRRLQLAGAVLVAANTAFLVWLALQFTLMLRYNYGYGDNPSTQLLSGGYVRPWFEQQSAIGAMAALFNVYGASYLLAPAGWLWAPVALRRLAWCALPIVAIFAYVQQPDRALWNIHFIVLPIAACALARVPQPWGWALVAATALANLRVGAQLTAVPDARVGHLIGVGLAVAVAYAALRARLRATPHPQTSHSGVV